MEYELLNEGRSNDDHRNAVTKCVISPNKQFLATCSADATIKVWNLQSLRLIQTLSGHSECVISVGYLSDKILVSGSYDTTIKFWDMNDYSIIQTIQNQHGYVQQLVLDKGKVIIGNQNHSISVLDNFQIVGTSDITDDPISCICITDNNKLVTTGFDDKFKFWDIETLQIENQFQTQNASFTSFVTSHNKQNSIILGCSSSIQVFNVEKNCFIKNIQVYQLGHNGSIYCIQINEEGTKLVTGGYDQQLKIWNIEDETCEQSLEGHQDWINSIQIIDDLIISGSDDFQVKFWKIKKTQQVQISCTICQDNFQGFMTSKCGHLAHEICWIKWLKIQESCPICKQVLKFDNLIKLYI